MLLLKRLLTTLCLLVGLFVIVFTGTMAVGGGIRGAELAAQHQEAASGFNQGFALGVRAGEEFRREYAPTVGLISLGVAAVAAVGLSFSGGVAVVPPTGAAAAAVRVAVAWPHPVEKAG